MRQNKTRNFPLKKKHVVATEYSVNFIILILIEIKKCSNTTRIEIKSNTQIIHEILRRIMLLQQDFHLLGHESLKYKRNFTAILYYLT